METNKIPLTIRAHQLLIINEMLNKTFFQQLVEKNICGQVRNKCRAKSEDKERSTAED